MGANPGGTACARDGADAIARPAVGAGFATGGAAPDDVVATIAVG